MKFYTVCTLPHYFPSDVYQLKRQLQLYYDGEVEMFVYTDRPSEFDNSVNVIDITHNKCVRQWYKIDFFGQDIVSGDDPIIVTDLDWIIRGDITDIIDMPITRSQFAAVERWWREPSDALKLNGGLYKFYPGTCIRSYNIFYSNPKFWQTAYYGPTKIAGEQDFTMDTLSLTHDIVYFPGESIGRYRSNNREAMEAYSKIYQSKYSNRYIVNGDFNSQVVMVHGRF